MSEMVLHNHPHIRKRSRGLEPYPARTFWLRILDTVVMTVGILGPVFTLPQIFKIYVGHNASGISVVTWGAYVLFNIPWILYGYVHKERPLAITYALWFFVNLSVFIGALLYGGGFF